jgi:(p)ppGpp synthase/HD superfamily hydrolase
MKKGIKQDETNEMENWKSLLDKALKIAVEAHHGQRDRYDQPYILHPIRVMQSVKKPLEKICAILHDVIEDSDWTLQLLKKEGFPTTILEALDCLTKRDGEAYQDYIRRAGQNPISRQVKLADLKDNMTLPRIDSLQSGDFKRLQKYHEAWKFLHDSKELSSNQKGYQNL